MQSNVVVVFFWGGGVMFHIHDNVPNKLKCYSVLFYSTNKSCQLLSSF